MRDKTHSEQIVRWARFVKNNDISTWKPMVKALTDSQIIMANRFYSNLIKTEKGKLKAEKLLKRKL
ncbi:hypothetical protein HYV88_03275 [Candidatus Woesearchaeota archaeon]|nr:hypothetical protein [Candidatus Woesearchaeota archaeon]